MKTDNKKDGKTREKQPYKYDLVIEAVRIITPCNRTNFNAMAVDKYLEGLTGDDGILDMQSIINDLQAYKLKNPKTTKTTKTPKQIPVVKLE